MLSQEFRKAWPYEFGLVYSVTLTKDALRTSLQVTNEGKENFEFQVLMHTYLAVEV
jgi:glucose-6-phosphate 1-epimerase